MMKSYQKLGGCPSLRMVPTSFWEAVHSHKSKCCNRTNAGGRLDSLSERYFVRLAMTMPGCSLQCSLKLASCCAVSGLMTPKATYIWSHLLVIFFVDSQESCGLTFPRVFYLNLLLRQSAMTSVGNDEANQLNWTIARSRIDRATVLWQFSDATANTCS